MSAWWPAACCRSAWGAGRWLQWGASDLTLEPVQSVASQGETRRKRAKKLSVRGVHEHFEAIFNAVSPTRSRS
ncbi:hypothetical protein DXT74_00340 [Chromobacterium sp. Rain0013]|nr:hypothetical protein DXT74_00340 [Chromobacterium sp. Rain0013]